MRILLKAVAHCTRAALGILLIVAIHLGCSRRGDGSASMLGSGCVSGMLASPWLQSMELTEFGGLYDPGHGRCSVLHVRAYIVCHPLQYLVFTQNTLNKSPRL